MRGNSHVRFGEKSRGNDPHKRHRAARLTPRPSCVQPSPHAWPAATTAHPATSTVSTIGA